MTLDLHQKAIELALTCDWKSAILINKQILKTNPKDIDALNRLARAYAEEGNIRLAKSTSQKVLKIDPFNTISKRSLEKWKKLKNSSLVSQKTSPEVFLEEPGKTKIVALIHLGDPNLLAELDAGDPVVLSSHSHRVSITTTEGKYIGRLADDLSAKIRKLMKLGYEYNTYLKSVDDNDVKIIIRETKRPIDFQGDASFPSDKINYVSFAHPELVHKNKEVITFDEE